MLKTFHPKEKKTKRIATSTMPPQPSSHICLTKTLPNLLRPNAFHSSTTVKTPQNPCQDLTSLLKTYKHPNQLSQIHALMTFTGLIHNPIPSSKLIASFALNPFPGTTCIARAIADRVNGLDSYTWNTILRGYLEENDPKEALLVYGNVRRQGLRVDSYTLQFATKACRDILEGEQIHSQIFKMGFLSELVIVTSIMQVYGLFGKVDYAKNVFDETPHRDVVLWNVLIALYAQRNYAQEALLVLSSMVNENVRLNEVTAVSILSACSYLGATNEGKQVHGFVLRNLVGIDVFVHNALMKMYAKCGYLFSARKVFQQMPMRNVVSWTTMINGYSDNNCPDEALVLFEEMENENVCPDEIMMLGIISMFSKSGSLKLTSWIDHYVEKKGFKDSVSVTNALIDMHSKCGAIDRACQIFDEMVAKTIVSWTTIIKGLAMHGPGIAALTRFDHMQREGFRPDNILFLSILSACSHAGLVDEGRKCFQSMSEDYDMKPQLEHYGCMVDLLCRAGLVGEALKFVEDMPINPDVIIWRTLLGACIAQGNTDLASQIRNRLLELEPKYSGNYILLSNMYATMGEWDSVNGVRTQMDIKGVHKLDPGCSSIEVN